MSAVLLQFIEILISGISGIATGVGEGISTLVQKVFLVAGENGAYTLSTFGGVIAIFAGLSLAIGLSRWVVGYISSLGSRH